MFYKTKRITLWTPDKNDRCDQPIIYLDWYTSPANLKFDWHSYDEFFFSFGFFNFSFSLFFRWGFVEREKTLEEIRDSGNKPFL